MVSDLLWGALLASQAASAALIVILVLAQPGRTPDATPRLIRAGAGSTLLQRATAVAAGVFLLSTMTLATHRA